MKIVQSLWSLPIPFEYPELKFVGWSHRKYYYYAWCLSSLRLSKFYKSLEFYGDTKSISLAKLLRLPYNSYVECLDQLNNQDYRLWSLGKLYSYYLMNEPFIHVDNDVIINQEFPDFDYVLVQSLELNTAYIQQLTSEFIDLKYYFTTDKSGSYNCGVLGFKDMQSKRDYVDAALTVMIDMSKSLSDSRGSLITTIAEQVVLYHYLNHHKVNVTKVLCEPSIEPVWFNKYKSQHSYNVNTTEFPLSDFTVGSKYFHPIGEFKSYVEVESTVEFLLMTEYPNEFDHVTRLINENKL